MNRSEQIIERLLALNHEIAAQEAKEAVAKRAKPKKIKAAPVKKAHQEALEQLVALLRLDPHTTDYDEVVHRHYQVNSSDQVARDWGTVLKIGVERKWIRLGDLKSDQWTIELGERAPKDATSKMQKVAQQAVGMMPAMMRAVPNATLYRKGYQDAVAAA